MIRMQANQQVFSEHHISLFVIVIVHVRRSQLKHFYQL